MKLTDTQFEAQIAVPVHWQTSSTVRTVFRLKLLTLSSKPRHEVLYSKNTKRSEANHEDTTTIKISIFKISIQNMTRRIFIGNGLSCASHSSPVKLCGRTSKTRLSRAKNRSRASVSRQILHSSWAQMKCGSNCASVSFALRAKLTNRTHYSSIVV